MRYFARYDVTGKLLSIGIGPGGTEITETEYNELLAIIREKAALVDKLYHGEITIDAIPLEWREEIQRRVDDRIAAEEAAAAEAEATEEDYINALADLGVTVNEES